MSLVTKATLLIRYSGFRHVLRILRYSLLRDRLDRKFRRKRKNLYRSPNLAPGNLIQAEDSISGAKFQFENASLEIYYLAPDLVRVSWQPGLQPTPYAIAKQDWPLVSTQLSANDEGWCLISNSLQVHIHMDGSLKFLSADGNLIRDEKPPKHMGNAEDASWISLAKLRSGECIYGLGQQANRLNLRGSSYQMWNSDPNGSYGLGKDPIYMTMPVYLSQHPDSSYLIFYENPFPATFTFPNQPVDDKESLAFAKVSFESGALRYYLVPGPPQRALNRFTELTGRPELPPFWSLGYHQSRWGYKTKAEIQRIAAGFKEHDLPLSAIHLDIDYMDGYRVFTVDQKRFPNLADLSSQLKEQNIQLVTIIDPGIKKDGDYFLYEEGVRENHFCALANGKPLIGMVWPGWSAFPDFTNHKTRAWWGLQYRRLLDQGVAGFWHDMNEPASFTAWDDPTLPLETRHNLDGNKGNHHQAHNLYGLLMNRAGFEGMKKLRPQNRPWIVSRSGWVSQQRYAWSWSADIDSNWECLRMTIAMVLNTGLCGQPYNGPDIGGFSGNPTEELYLRWFQLAAFLPFFRTHSSIGSHPREPWVFGDPYTSIIRDYLRLRERLLPYLYTLAWQASQAGYPLVRPLFWIDPGNKNLWEVDDAFLLGDNLLIAPALVADMESREITLPTGTWFSWWDDTPYQGPGIVNYPVSLEKIPILVRGASIVPLHENNNLILHVYPDQKNRGKPSQHLQSSAQLYSDAGDGYGDWRLDEFHMQQNGNRLQISRQSQGSYEFPYLNLTVHYHGHPADKAWVDDQLTQLVDNQIQTGPFNNLIIEA